MDIHEPFPEMTQHNQHILVITDRYFKLTRAIYASKSTSTHVENHFFDHCIVPYVILTYLFTDNNVQLDSKLFASLCTLHGIRRLTTTPYHLQTSGQAARYNKTILTCLRHYVMEHQKDPDSFVQPLTCGTTPKCTAAPIKSRTASF